MKEHPILFNGEMIRAVLDGRKTQTRRIIKPQPDDFTDQPVWMDGEGHSGYGWYCADDEYRDEGSLFYRCPYGQVGDQLWVRETFAVHGMLFDDLPPRDLAEHKPECLWYAASGDGCTQGECEAFQRGKWRPSIFMPRWASRINLEVTGVRVERVQDIRCYDIRGEGVDCPDHDFPGGFCTSECASLRQAFATLWDSINAKRGFGWESNPWVWVIEFKKLEAEQCASSI